MEKRVAADLGSLTRIWTYPVKSLRGIAHDSVAVEESGLAGDRRAALFVATEEHARTGKTYRGKEDSRLHLLDDPDHARRAAEERGVSLEVHVNGERHFDAGIVSLILDCWIGEVERSLGRRLDPLRWRPNFLIASAREVPESELVGARLGMGSVVLRVWKPIGRCVTTTYDQQTGVSDPEVLSFVARERDNQMGVYCDVERSGTASVGDALRILA